LALHNLILAQRQRSCGANPMMPYFYVIKHRKTLDNKIRTGLALP